ncbi:MAG: cupin domain-containing protein [Actinobacteria bacterium]|nr:cupin domain-containing protein [Actinomycetota bacterium]
MPFFHFDNMEKEYATPKYSTAFGELVAGDKLEMGRLTFEAGEGAVEHAHPQEQIMYVISGRLKVEFADETQEIGPGSAFVAPSNMKHRVTALQNTTVISVKDLVDGIGHKLAPDEKDRLEELGKI